MAGIYVHVPFCRKKCLYCDFYSVGSTVDMAEFPDLIVKEISLRKGLITTDIVETIYFGGGTPSLIPSSSIQKIIAAIYANFSVSSKPEITIEVNPDDVNENLIKDYRNAGVNRISLGVQSFIDDELKFLGRRHGAKKSHEAIKQFQDLGFDNISVDLIYGIPGSRNENWGKNLTSAVRSEIQHLSCYHLTFEEGTPLYRKMVKKEIAPIDEDLSIKQFHLLREITTANGFEHYEVSNFAKKGFYSKHNTAYWQGVSYLGVGPAAHSYNGNQRYWNPRSIKDWKIGLASSSPLVEGEILDINTQFNEILLTRLRTTWGINILVLKNDFGDILVSDLLKSAEKYLNDHVLVFENNVLKIPSEYFFISDRIISDLMVV